MDLNWISIILVALAGFLVGGLWYGPAFGKAWQRESRLTEEEMQSCNMPMIFGLTFLLNLFSAAVLAHVLRTYGDPGVRLAVMISGGIALGFIVPAIGVNYLFSRRSFRLFAIDAGYWFLVYCVMGLIFGGLV